MFLQRQHRKTKYSNPLTGTVYNNQQYLTHCQAYLDTDLKLSTTTTEDLDLKTPSLKRTSQGFHPQPRQVGPRQVYSASHPFERSQRPLNKQSEHLSHPHLTDRGNLTTASKGSRHLQTKRTSLVETSISQNNVGIKMSQRRTLKRKLAINPFVDGYLFPSVQIRIIHKITSVGGIPFQSISFSFEKIFKRLIRTQIMGQFTSNFMFKMEHYLRRIVEKDEIYQNPLGIELEQSIRSISRKQDLLDLILQLEIEGNTPKIEEIVKYYCIPSDTVAQQIFKELIDDIVIEIFEKKNCCKDIQYCLLSQEGNRIVHLSEIFFSTRCLLIAPESTFSIDFERYRKMLQEHDKQQRMTFKQSIKHNFINKIVFNKLEQNLVNYTKEPKEQVHHRQEIIEKAEVLLLSKSKLRLQRNRPSPNKQLSLGDLKFEEPTFTRQTLYNSYTQRKFNEKKEYKEIITKLHHILDPNNSYSVKSKLDKKTEEQFSKLHRLNEQYDITYLHNPDNSNKLLLQNLLQNCHIFNTKTQSQIKKIISVIEKLYGRQNCTLKEIQFWQFKEIFQTAHGVSQPSLIMKFVISYLNFDEWGQIQKKDMFKLLQVAVPFKGRSLDLIRSIVWNWLQRCKLVESGALRKRNIEIWYQPVRVVYLLFLSIIFGTEYHSFQQMLSELLKYQFY